STARYEVLVGSRGGAAPGVAEGGELAHYNLGVAFRQKALYEEALREFRLATERGEDMFLVQQAQAVMLMLRGDSAAALDLYRTLIEQESGSPKIWNELGVAHHQTGNLAEAEEAYDRALELDPNYALAWNNLGVVRHHRDDDTAETAFRSAAAEGRAAGDVWRNYALMLHRAGRREESAEAYDRSLDADDHSAQAHTGYGILLMELGRPGDARAQLLQAVEIDPQLPEARYHLAFAMSALGEFEGALRETKLALEMNPYIPTPRFRLLVDMQFEEASVLAPELDATALVAGGDVIRSFDFQPDLLDSVFSDGVTAKPPISTADRAPGDDALAAARTALATGLLEQASADAQRAALYGASRIEVLLLQGEIFLRRGASGEAVERFDEALAGIARDTTGDYDEALRRALHGAARSLLDLGHMPQAVEAAERLCALAPGDVEALRTLGEVLSRVADHARAAIVLEQARLSAPNDSGLLTQLGAAYAEAGDLDGAESALQHAVAQDPFAVRARTVLGNVLMEIGRTGEAEAQYREALRVLPTYGEAVFGLAALEEGRGRLHEAVHVLVDLLTIQPYRPDALIRLGDLLLATGRPAEARFAFARALRIDPHSERARAAMSGMEPAQA
ncbi:MAG: tetratricopeptide repeat protein, partial [Gemmatimonadota bacterium]